MNTASTPRIVIENLPAFQTLTDEEMAVILGAGRFRPMLEQLETREVMSANVVSSLGGVNASFNLTNGILSETQGPQVGVQASGVQGLFQGQDSAGHQVAYEWLNNGLSEFTPDQGWVGIGNADQVVQDNNGSVLFTQGTSLFLATGVPGNAVPLLGASQPGTITLGGFTLSNASVILGPGGATVSGTTALPLVGSVQLTGTISDDGSQFSLSAPVSSATIGGFSLTNDTITLSNAGISLTGTATLPVVGSVTLNGSVSADGSQFSLSAPVSSATIGGFSLTNDTITLSNTGIALTGTATLPIVGSVTLNGSVSADGSQFSLTAPVSNLTIADISLSNATVTLANSGLSLSAQADLAVVGDVTFIGAISPGGSWSLSGSPANGSLSLLGGLVQFNDETVTLTANGVTLTADATVAHLGAATFEGSIGTGDNYSLTATVSINVAGFSVDGAVLTLGSNDLQVDFTLPVPEIGDVAFSGSYGPNGQWSLSATYPGPVEVGPVTLTDLGFTLTNDSLTLQATGSIADLQGLVNAQATGTFYTNGGVNLKLTVNALQVGNFELGQTWVDVTNINKVTENPGSVWTMELHGVVGIQNANVTLDGFVDTQGNYDLTGTQDFQVGGLTLSQMNFELKKGQGFTFSGTWNYLVANFNISGTIATDGEVQFSGTAQTTQLPNGFELANGSIKADLNPTNGNYSIEVKGSVDVSIATLNLDVTASMSGGVWQTPTLTTTAQIGGPLASILSGSAQFTIQPNEVTFTGNLSIPNVPNATYTVNGSVMADGTLVIGGFAGQVGAIVAADAARILHQVGADASTIGKVLVNLYQEGAQDVAKQLLAAGVAAGDIAASLKTNFSCAALDTARILYNLGVTGSSLTSAIQSSYNQTVNYFYNGTKEVYQEVTNGVLTLERDWQNGVQVLDATWANGVNTMSYVWNTAGQYVSQYWVSGNQALQNLYTSGLRTEYTVWTNGVKTLDNIYNTAGTLLSSYWQSGSKFIYQQYTNGVATLEQDWQNGVQVLYATWANGVNTMSYVWNTAGQYVSQYWVSGNQAFQNLYTSGLRTEYTVWTNGVKTLDNVYNTAGRLLSSYWQSGSKFIYQQYTNGVATLEQDWQNGVQVLYATWANGVNTMSYVWNTAGQYVSQYWVSGNQAFQNLYTSGLRTEYTVWTNGVKTLDNVYNTAGRLLSSYWQSGSKFIYQQYTNGVATLEQDWQNGVQVLYGTWATNGANTMYYVWNTAGQYVSQYWVSGNQAFQNLYTSGLRTEYTAWTNGVKTLDNVYSTAGRLLSSYWQSGSKFIYQQYTNGVATLEQDWQNGVQVLYGTWATNGANTMYYVWNTAGQWVSAYWVSGNQTFQNLYTNGDLVAQDVWTNGKQTAEYVWNTAGTYLGNAWNNAGSAASNFINKYL